MRLTVVGCAGSYPSAESPASCYLLEHDGSRILLDLGNGAFGALQRHIDVLDDDALDGVVLSHLHADHCLDLCAMHVARQYRPAGAMPRIPVLAPRGANARMAQAYGMAERPGMTQRFEFLVHRPGVPVTIGGFTVHSVRVAHPVEAYAVRIEAGGVALAYSGDTGATEALLDIARDVDLAVFEASWSEPRADEPARPVDLHMSGREAGQHARRAGARRLLLTHLVPWADAEAIRAEATGAFDGPVDLARSGLVIDLAPGA